MQTIKLKINEKTSYEKTLLELIKIGILEKKVLKLQKKTFLMMKPLMRLMMSKKKKGLKSKTPGNFSKNWEYELRN